MSDFPLPIPLFKKLPWALLFLIALLWTYPQMDTTSGSMLVSGKFTQYANETSNQLVRIKQEDGSNFGKDALSTFDPPFSSGSGTDPGHIYAIESNADETRFLIGGDFTQYNGVTATRIIAIDADGTPDPSFVSGSGFNGIVHVIKRDPWMPDKYYVGGEFTTYNGETARGIVRLNSDGSMDQGFFGSGVQLIQYKANAGRVVTIAFHKPAGMICFGGSFTHYDGQPHNNIACKSLLGKEGRMIFGNKTVRYKPFTLSMGFFQVPGGAAAFDPVNSYEDEVVHIEIDDANNKIYVSGQFNTYANEDPGGGFTPYLAIATSSFCRLNMDGSYDMGYPYQRIANKRMGFVLDEPNAVIIGAKSYGEGADLHYYASLIKFDRDTKELDSEFAMMQIPAESFGSVHSKQILHGTGEWSDYIYLLIGDSGQNVYTYNQAETNEIIRIHHQTGEIDPSFVFGPNTPPWIYSFKVLKENDYGLFDWILEHAFGIAPDT